MRKIITALMLMVLISTPVYSGLTSTYEATYTDVHVVLEAVVLGDDPWWIPLWMTIRIVGTTPTGETETISIGCIPLSIFIWSIENAGFTFR